MPKSRELMDKVLAAWAVYRETAATFEKLNAEIIGDAHGMQASDGLLAIHDAAAKRTAFEAYPNALREYTDYLMAVEAGRQQGNAGLPTQQ
jgi:hypothetical protein